MTWVPAQACTLPTEQQPLRVAEFDDLFARSLTAVRRHDPGRVSLLLRDSGSVLQQAQELADRETTCCSFFSFTLRRTSGHVEMGIEVPLAHTAVLAALADRAERILVGEPS